MADNAGLAEFKQGIELLRNGYPDKAIIFLQQAADLKRQNPYYLSFLGVSMVRARRPWTNAVELCKTALSLRRDDVQLYLNLAEVYTSAGRRGEAVRTLDNAVRFCGPDERIRRHRGKLGRRRSPVLPFLDRGNILNRHLGRLRYRMFSHLRAIN
jgi:Flp pilus assembly protein TadD